ncbi:hypothetical protein GF402_07990 [Candidatus Fermentibacteria bacterium]|nr:hypothetical protein [Candidatus Fermentibacteria bacterium]
MSSEIRAFLHRKKAQLKRLEADVEDLRAEFESSGREKSLLGMLGDDLDAIRDKAARRLSELEKAGEESLEELRKGADGALNELRKGLESARKRLHES